MVSHRAACTWTSYKYISTVCARTLSKAPCGASVVKFALVLHRMTIFMVFKSAFKIVYRINVVMVEKPAFLKMKRWWIWSINITHKIPVWGFLSRCHSQYSVNSIFINHNNFYVSARNVFLISTSFFESDNARNSSKNLHVMNPDRTLNLIFRRFTKKWLIFVFLNDIQCHIFDWKNVKKPTSSIEWMNV